MAYICRAWYREIDKFHTFTQHSFIWLLYHALQLLHCSLRCKAWHCISFSALGPCTPGLPSCISCVRWQEHRACEAGLQLGKGEKAEQSPVYKGALQKHCNTKAKAYIWSICPTPTWLLPLNILNSTNQPQKLSPLRYQVLTSTAKINGCVKERSQKYPHCRKDTTFMGH